MTADPARGTRRRWQLLKVLVAVGLLVAAAVARPEQLRSSAQSPRAWLFVGAVVLATVLVGLATRRLAPPVSAALGLVPMIAAAVFLIPTLRDTTVDEDLEGIAPVGVVVSASPGASSAPAPVRLATGDVKGIGHRGSGSASLVRLADGKLVVRLESFSVDPGPDYDVYVVPGAGRESPEGGTKLADLKGTSGNQNYPLGSAPGDLPLTVLVWCEAFSVPIAAATLTG